MSEHRQYPRQPVHVTVVVELPGGQTLTGTSRDVSLGGMFVETPQTAPFGTKVRVRIHLPLAGDATLEATVRWTTQQGMGVQFAPMGAKETYGLMELVKG